MEEMAEGVAFAHAHGVRVYVTANILAHNYDLDGVREYFSELHNMKPDRPDALIIADPAVFMIAKEVCPEIERHVSTQANNTNYGTYITAILSTSRLLAGQSNSIFLIFSPIQFCIHPIYSTPVTIALLTP